MPGKHKNGTISFRPTEWERSIIEQRASLSGLYKKDFIARSCIYSNIVVVGKKENIQIIVNTVREMQYVMQDIVSQLETGDVSLSKESYKEFRNDILALAITVVDILNGAAYLWDKEVG